MKVLLLRPNSSMVKAPPPLGMVSVAAYARRAGHDVRVHDARVKRSSDAAVARVLRDADPDVVGISLLSVEATAGHRLASLVKNIVPRAYVVLGGPYVTSEPDDILSNENVDAGVVGEGEETFAELLSALSGGDGTLPSLPGVVTRDGGTDAFVHRPPIGNVDCFPFPAYDLLDLRDYFRSTIGVSQNMFQFKKRALPVFTSRGCPFHCTYCHMIFGKTFRARSAENVLEEVRWMRRMYGVEEIHFSDDIFNVVRARAFDICEGLSRDGGLHLAFPNGLRADIMDRDLVRAMGRAGAFRMTYAIESGSDAIQKKMNKHLNLDKAMQAVEWTAAEGINTGGFFILGFPDETRDQIMETVKFALRSPLHTASFFYLIPFPGTVHYDEAIRRGHDRDGLKKILHHHMMDFNKPTVNMSAVSDAELIGMKKHAIRKFYVSPTRLYRTLSTLPASPATLADIAYNSTVILRLIYSSTVND